jgi:protein-tyrosine phosphatase
VSVRASAGCSDDRFRKDFALNQGFVDIHSHIIHGLDDGSPSLQVSVEMLSMAAESGTSDIVATPHANSEFSYDPALVAEKLAELRASTKTGIRIHSGCDFHLSFQNVQDAVKEPSKYTINNTQYLLVELPSFTVYPNIAAVFRTLMDTGIVPIITHPERNAVVQREMRALRGWVESGCLVQITAQSLLAGFGSKPKRFSDDVLGEGLAHFVSSDAHDCQRRVPRLDLAYQYVIDRFGEQTANLLFIENPGRVLKGLDIESTSPEKPAGKRRWYNRLLGVG